MHPLKVLIFLWSYIQEFLGQAKIKQIEKIDENLNFLSIDMLQLKETLNDSHMHSHAQRKQNPGRYFPLPPLVPNISTYPERKIKKKIAERERVVPLQCIG
jgi:hypothetical protein